MSRAFSASLPRIMYHCGSSKPCRRSNMYRLGLALSAMLVYATVAQAQTISVPTFVVDPGATINVTVTGTPGQNYALIGSITNSGFTFAGVNLSVGVDV